MPCRGWNGIMSNRSLIEINHDHTHEIEKDPEKFVANLLHYLRAGALDRRLGHDELSREVFRGVRVVGMRHHSYSIRWGAVQDVYKK